MSRYYKVEVDVRPCSSPADVGFAKEVLEQEGMECDGDTEIDEVDGTHSFWGHVTLSGSQGVEDMHKVFTGALPKGTKIMTRWLCMDDVPWDEEIEDPGFEQEPEDTQK